MLCKHDSELMFEFVVAWIGLCFPIGITYRKFFILPYFCNFFLGFAVGYEWYIQSFSPIASSSISGSFLPHFKTFSTSSVFNSRTLFAWIMCSTLTVSKLARSIHTHTGTYQIWNKQEQMVQRWLIVEQTSRRIITKRVIMVIDKWKA